MDDQQINQLTEQIYRVNGKIVVAKRYSDQQAMSELYDLLDQLVQVRERLEGVAS